MDKESAEYLFNNLICKFDDRFIANIQDWIKDFIKFPNNKRKFNKLVDLVLNGVPTFRLDHEKIILLETKSIYYYVPLNCLNVEELEIMYNLVYKDNISICNETSTMQIIGEYVKPYILNFKKNSRILFYTMIMSYFIVFNCLMKDNPLFYRVKWNNKLNVFCNVLKNKK